MFRFWCWLWTGHKTRDVYGLVNTKTRGPMKFSVCKKCGTAIWEKP